MPLRDAPHPTRACMELARRASIRSYASKFCAKSSTLRSSRISLHLGAMESALEVGRHRTWSDSYLSFAMLLLMLPSKRSLKLQMSRSTPWLPIWSKFLHRQCDDLEATLLCRHLLEKRKKRKEGELPSRRCHPSLHRLMKSCSSTMLQNGVPCYGTTIWMHLLCTRQIQQQKPSPSPIASPKLHSAVLLPLVKRSSC
jgi:hypothetical protein